MLPKRFEDIEACLRLPVRTRTQTGAKQALQLVREAREVNEGDPEPVNAYEDIL